NIDEAPPTLSGAPTTPPNTAGWYNASVAVHWTCADALSGISGGCPADSTIASEGSGLTASASVSDLAGNTASAQSSPAVKIDKTPPSISDTHGPVPNGAGWNNTSVTVTFTCADALSGIATCTAPQTVSTEGLNQPVGGTATDSAGNSAADSTTVSIDKTPP